VPWWKDLLPAAEALPPADLPPGSVAGYLLEVPLMEMPVYMPYLLQRFHQLGGQIEQRAINTLSDITYPDRIIINCTGVWARQVANDPSVFPLRGQVLKVNAPHIKTGFLGEGGDEDTLTYIVPRRDGCILGGTAQKDNWNLAADPHIAKAIRARCAAVEPSLQTAEVLSQAVGLRPGRHEVRLEVERMADSCIIIHNYGHGGAGVTLSWGCADEVVTLALSVLPEMNQS
jgi:D-amino-acid oxidase